MEKVVKTYDIVDGLMALCEQKEAFYKKSYDITVREKQFLDVFSSMTSPDTEEEFAKLFYTAVNNLGAYISSGGRNDFEDESKYGVYEGVSGEALLRKVLEGIDYINARSNSPLVANYETVFKSCVADAIKENTPDGYELFGGIPGGSAGATEFGGFSTIKQVIKQRTEEANKELSINSYVIKFLKSLQKTVSFANNKYIRPFEFDKDVEFIENKSKLAFAALKALSCVDSSIKVRSVEFAPELISSLKDSEPILNPDAYNKFFSLLYDLLYDTVEACDSLAKQLAVKYPGIQTRHAIMALTQEIYPDTVKPLAILYSNGSASNAEELLKDALKITEFKDVKATLEPCRDL